MDQLTVKPWLYGDVITPLHRNGWRLTDDQTIPTYQGHKLVSTVWVRDGEALVVELVHGYTIADTMGPDELGRDIFDGIMSVTNDVEQVTLYTVHEFDEDVRQATVFTHAAFLKLVTA